ncbi:MAG: 2-aminoethylphosphonate-pyruvate transaminase [Paracrocinitomix sp.]|jgi:2-aminoethylphosphonate-pyruvate transaminase
MKYLLFTPGPVNVATNVRSAVAGTDICHREVEFERVLRSIEGQLLDLFEIRQQGRYQAVVITGSGTAANEAMLSSVVGNQNILVLANGEFGERLHEISEIHNEHTSLLQFGWGERMDLAVIEDHLGNNHVDVIAMVHHETSSGILNPLQAIGALARAHDITLVVDCVSSAGAEIVDMERDHIAFCSSSSSKAIGSYSGLSFVVGKRAEFKKLRTIVAKTKYLDLYKFYQFATDRSQTPNTPAVSLFYALDQALANILSETVVGRRATVLAAATRLRSGMSELGLTFLLDANDMCSVLTTVHVPPGIEIERLRHALRRRSIIIYEGKGPLKGRVFQVGNIGELNTVHVTRFLSALRDSLLECQVVQSIEPNLLLTSAVA